jgi:very-short-patch-repair endonuclease
MRGTTPEIERRAKDLRAKMTPAENVMWMLLRKHRQAGFYFRRQHPIARFIVDFCCTKAKLCIEVDGGIHDDQRERDDERTAWLESMGYRVLRFRNEDVLNAPHRVARDINHALQKPAVIDDARALGCCTRTAATTSPGTGEVASLSEPERALSRRAARKAAKHRSTAARYGRGGELWRAGEGAEPRNSSMSGSRYTSAGRSTSRPSSAER